jgi:hypothetical protein
MQYPSSAFHSAIGAQVSGRGWDESRVTAHAATPPPRASSTARRTRSRLMGEASPPEAVLSSTRFYGPTSTSNEGRARPCCSPGAPLPISWGSPKKQRLHDRTEVESLFGDDFSLVRNDDGAGWVDPALQRRLVLGGAADRSRTDRLHRLGPYQDMGGRNRRRRVQLGPTAPLRAVSPLEHATGLGG